MRIPRLVRVASALAACALGAGVLAGCGGSSSDGKTTITFMEAMSSGTLKTAMEHLTKQFEAAHKNIDVQLIPESDYGTLRDKETAAVTSGKPPTIGQVYEDWAATYASSNVIVPLSDYAKAGDVSAFYPGIQQDLYLPGHKLDMWPFNKSVVIQYYNEKMLKAKGLSAPKTWAEFATTAKKISGNGVTGIAIDPGNSAGPGGGEAWYEILSTAYGAPVFAANGAPKFTSGPAVQAMQYLVDLKKAGALTLGKNYPGQVALGAGKGGFDVSSVASYYYDQQAVGGKFPMGTAPLPTGPGGTEANQMAGTNIVMFAKASDQEKQAAWQYLKFLGSASSQAYWAQTSGYLPVTPAAFGKMSKPAPYLKFAASELKTTKADPPYSWVTTCQGDLAVAMQSALTGKQSATAALSDAQKQCTDTKNSGQ